jgi:ubiquinol-cytochrome c reductase cytochrome b subunit
VLNRFRDWLDDRTGYRALRELLLVEPIPGGARWRYVFGSCLAFVFSLQLITGLLLMTAYSPGDSTAWGSVYFIQYRMEFGWFIRGLHHFGSQGMVVLLGLHMLQVVLAGAHLPPREINWWLGMLLLGVTLGLSLTGYLLPWDQKGYWATQVATNIAANLPVIGRTLSKILVGGASYGHHTLTRFFALHVGILPLTLILLLVAHIAVFRRHGITHPKDATSEGWFWPDQAFKDMVACLAVLAVLVGLVIAGPGNSAVEAGSSPLAAGAAGRPSWWTHAAFGGWAGRGAHLDAPADPSRPYPARPEWYFLFLFQLLKYFEGEKVLIGTVMIPFGTGLLLFILPLLGHGRMRAIGHAFAVCCMVALFGAVGVLTYEAMDADRANESFQHARAEATELGHRAIALAADGIPPEGAVMLLRRDPVTRGPELFRTHCATCHRYGKQFSQGGKASDLEGFAREPWVLGLLTKPGPGHDKYFGKTELREMQRVVEEDLKDLEPEDQENLRRVARWLAGHPRSSSADAKSDEFQRGLAAFQSETLACNDCHGWEGKRGPGTAAPDLTGYGDADWVRAMIMSPDHPSRYGSKNAMPIFRNLEGPDGPIVRQEFSKRKPAVVHIDDIEREIIVRWLTGDRRAVID